METKAQSQAVLDSIMIL